MVWDGIQSEALARCDTLWDRMGLTDKIPSLRSISQVALSGFAAAQSVLAFGPDGRASSTCANPQLSCQNSSAIQDLCCFNAPGGALLLTQFWDTSPVVGPEDSWTIQ